MHRWVLTVGLAALLGRTSPGNAVETDGTPASAPLRVTLNVWIMPNAANRNEDRFMRLVEPFLKAHRNVRINVTVLPWEDAWGKIRASVNGGPAPDIVQLGTTWTAAVAASGQLMDLSGTFSETSFLPQVLAATTVEGQGKNRGRRFGMPWLVDVRALYYNKEACARAGVDPKTDFETWASFKAALKKLSGVEVGGKRMHSFGMPAKTSYDALHDFAWWIWGAGGDFLAPDLRSARINSRESLAGIEFYTSLYREGLMSRIAFDRNAARVQQMLRQGEIATTISVPIPDLPESDFGVTLLPAGPRGRFTFLGGSTLSVYQSCPNQKEAVELLRFLASPEAQETYARMTGFLPVASRLYDDAAVKVSPVRALSLLQIKTGRGYPSIPEWGAIEEVLRPGLGSTWDVVLGRSAAGDETTVKDVLDRMAGQIDRILRPPAPAQPRRKP